MNIFIYTRATYALFFHAWNAMIVDERLNGPINKSILVLSCRDEEVYLENAVGLLRERTPLCKNGGSYRGEKSRARMNQRAGEYRRPFGVEPRESHVLLTYIGTRQDAYIFVMAVFGKIRRLHSRQRRSPVCFLNLRLRSLERKANPRNPRQIYTHTVVSGE